MKNHFLKIAYLPFILAILFASKIFVNKIVAQSPVMTVADEGFQPAPQSENRVQLAILLDVSGSMSGLIEQAKTQLWSVVNELAYARRDGFQPKLEIALYSYGEGGTFNGIPFINQLTPFSTDLDLISQKLFSLSTTGSNEYCGQVIQLSIDQLAWSESPDDLKIVFIAGNEPFSQGPVPYEMACKAAKKNDVIVNTIYCGAAQEGINSGWLAGASMTGGRYMHIDHNQQTTFISTPYDQQIGDLNSRLNQTYIRYGSTGHVYEQNQITQDNNASGYSRANLSSRAASKASGMYKCDSWDLVDAKRSKNGIALDTVSRAYLPKELQDKSTKELEAFVEEKAQERDKISKELIETNKKREAYLQEERKKQGQENTLDRALIECIQQQGKTKSFEFKEKG